MSTAELLKTQKLPNRDRNDPLAAETKVPEGAVEVALLTGGGDKHYSLDLATSLISSGVFVDFIGSDETNGPQLHNTSQVNFLNSRGDQNPSATRRQKVLRWLRYYARLLRYAAVAKPGLFDILRHNRLELVDRT